MREVCKPLEESVDSKKEKKMGSTYSVSQDRHGAALELKQGDPLPEFRCVRRKVRIET